jgi:hypothetical protein
MNQQQLNAALLERFRLDPSLGVRLFHATNGAIKLLEMWSRKDPAESQVLRELLAARDLTQRGIDHEQR